MKTVLTFFAALLAAGTVSAHPSYGLVVTDDGSIFFTDILHDEGTVWRLDTAGVLTKVLTGQHSHYLFKGPDGEVWGTDHDYLPATGGNRNTLWKLTAGLSKEVVIPPTTDPAEFSGVNFVVNTEGKILFDYQSRLYIREPQGVPGVFLDRAFGRIMSLQFDRGDLYVVDTRTEGGTVYRVRDGEAVVVADHLLEKDPPDPPFADPSHNLLFAAFVDQSGSVFVANSGSRKVIRVDPAGERTDVYRSSDPWYPVAYGTDGSRSYVLEYGYRAGTGNIGPRLLRVTPDGNDVLFEADTLAE